MSLHPNDYLAGIHDVMAAEMLAAASQSHVEAAELSDSLNDLLGAAYLCRQRAARLNGAAARATYSGQHDLAAMIGAAATKESASADEFELVGASCVRGMHSFGYLSDMEKRQLARDAFLQSASASQVDNALEALTKKLYDDVTNFGVDPDGFGGEHEPEEMGGEGCAVFGMAAEMLGGDVPVVFGDEFYDAFGKLFKPSADRLRKRQERLQNRLEKLTDKLEALEDKGKTGFRVRILQKRIDVMENRLEKIAGKLESLEGSREQVEESREKAAVVKAAEQSSIDASMDIDDDFPEDDDEDDDDDDFGLMSEAEVFGVSERRSKRIRRRIERLKKRMARLSERDRGPLREKRIAKLQQRIAKLESKLSSVDGDDDLDDDFDDLDEEESYTASLMTPKVRAFSEDEFLSSFAGMLANSPGSANRQPYVQFFRRKMDRHGSLNLSPAVMGSANDTFYSGVGGFFAKLLSAAGKAAKATGRGVSKGVEAIASRRPQRQARRQARRSEARDYVKQKAQALQARKAAARIARQEARLSTDLRAKVKAAREARREVRRSGRSATYRLPNGVVGPAPKLPKARCTLRDGEYVDMRPNASYVYIVEGGTLSVAAGPSGVFDPPVLPPGGQDEAIRNLKADIDAGHVESCSKTGSAARRRPVPMPRRRAMRRRAMKRQARATASRQPFSRRRRRV
tara:strand:+ start:715 stop:2772 length:2058 start_codon:yes stop_codon:yes gene_type:complete